MTISRFWMIATASLCLSGFFLNTPIVLGQRAATASADTVPLDRVTSSMPLPNGLEIRDGKARIQITALRDDVLRIRVSRTQALPEEDSRAVLPRPRTHAA